MPVYATFGFGFFERDQLAAAAKLWQGRGFKRLKMTVGNHAISGGYSQVLKIAGMAQAFNVPIDNDLARRIQFGVK